MIKVQYFAHLKDVSGVEIEQFKAAGKTIAELKKMISDKYHVTGLDSTMTAINEEFSDDNRTLVEGDHVAFIPPVSGG